MKNTTPSPAAMASLQQAPRRIRPPFNMDSPEPSIEHLAGDQWRAHRHNDRVAALLEALDGVELGTYDRRIIEWLAGWDVSTVGTVASLFYRARALDGAR
ncbi:hypothetical protein LWC34_45605 [Kibdelosporangium philippinense]|uniref:Uncharacterized protein n=1 Tax=Kibdelosporangium philippinense TaxID=211113 RepID=A0ABS8ZQZ8_9PSEU|nr:hypothetical protein [Kibdelosporangium philippinense]MCE7010037.1 hypothetical protein [Kibdelosporangium philippinense]